MTIDPRIGFWFSVVAAIVSALLLCGAEFTTLFGEFTTGQILAALGIANVVINGINAVLHAIPAAKPTPQNINKYLLGPSA